MAKPLSCLLVVEDEPAIRDLIVAFLKAGGYPKIVTAGNAEEALFYIMKDPGLRIQLALVDIVLPNANGLTLIRKIREAKTIWRRNLPVIVLTGRTDTGTYKAAARRGIQGYLMKPISPAMLLQTVNDVLAARGIAPPEPLKPAGGISTFSTVEDVAPPPTLDEAG